ncbi:MAG: biosynthetic arginine decarboxylase [Mariniblastus sp.]|nr:biosynthetic arginine decarboxylase [Mariniblastus sp.]
MTTSEPALPNETSRRDPAHNRTEKKIDEPFTNPSWTLDQARDLYGIQRWGLGYFGISASGSATVQAPTPEGVKTIEFSEILDGLKQRGLNMPVMLRFENLVDDRITQLHEGFASAIAQTNYESQYRGVFPIKVNQQSHVIAEIARFGERFNYGLEAGSKAELLIALATLPSPESLIICNGYKDIEYIDLGLQALSMGLQVFFVIETPKELPMILDRAKHWGVTPCIGVRLKLSTAVDGHWSRDTGDRSLFGLSTLQLIEIIDSLRDAGMLDSLKMLHFHLGSQVPNIRNVRDGITEACRFYVNLIEEGAPMGYFDIGGGLAVDYDGSASIDGHSRNYDLDEYCVDIVEAIMAALDQHDIPHPTIISESGRWTVAPMSVLLFNILDVNDFQPQPLPDPLPENIHPSIDFLIDTLRHIEVRRLQENFNDAVYYRDQARKAFQIGELSLRERAIAENICLTILHQIADRVPEMTRPPASLQTIKDSLSDIYYGNFSVFQSLPDAWAIQQVFPVMPLQRLDEEPTRNAIIGDLTCDCDGQLNQFVGTKSNTKTLRLHPIDEGEEYCLGVFLVGAYQETLGDLHNLFGDTHVVSVRVTSLGQLEFVHELKGDSIRDVLSYVEYQTEELFSQFEKRTDTALSDGKISVAQRTEILELFSESLRGYTYFEN